MTIEREIAGRKLVIETGRWARQSEGSAVVRYGDSVVLATAQSATAREDIDFFPLTVDYREKTAAAGKFPGGFFKREGRPTTKEILTCRLIDRPLRPLFPEGYRAEVQVMSQVLATDQENDPDLLAMIASFAAVHASSIPFTAALGACRVGRDGAGNWLVNPTYQQLESKGSVLHLTVAAHREAIVMVEAGARNVSEDVMVEALELAHDVCGKIVEMLEELREKAGKPKAAFTPIPRNEDLEAEAAARFRQRIREAAVSPGPKQHRKAALDAVKQEFVAAFPPPQGATERQARAHGSLLGRIFDDLAVQGERESILEGRRADGRGHGDIREISCDVGVIPRVHGSALFTRGETQALVVATLGSVDDEQIIDGLFPEFRKRFLLHYSFPPFSVGEVKPIRGPGRREVGHGVLAERAVEAVLPDHASFPYTVRITSEILESNGSSSMATVCGATLALMDAGVPIRQPVAGVAMGLVVEGERLAILSDILGSEDHCGDMDFKVAGTQYGITSLQMDIKCSGLSRDVMRRALEQAREGRMHVLRAMLSVIRRPRTEVSPYAPRLEIIKINPEKIGLVIGPGGKNIRAMQEDYACKIAVEDDGTVVVSGTDAEKVAACLKRIRTMTAEVEVGGIYVGKVVSIKEFGAFVEVLPGQEGLCHVSELSDGFVRSVTDAVRIGDEIAVKVLHVDEFGKIKLSRKAALQQERGGQEAAGPEGRDPRPAGDGPGDDAGPGGEEASLPVPEGAGPERRDRGERGNRGGDRPGGRREGGERGGDGHRRGGGRSSRHPQRS